jgi:uncharacterized membrane protein YfcA
MVYLELLIAGLAAGYLAGLLGIGGGFVVVPVLMLLLPKLGVAPDIAPQVAVATSLAAMVPTAMMAALSQHRRGQLDLQWVARLAPGAALGAALGARIAQGIDGTWIAGLFTVYAGTVAWKMLRDRGAAAESPDRKAPVIARLWRPSIGVAIGSISALAGVGGASLTIPYLLHAAVEMRRAVAISSAVGLSIATAGSLSFILGSRSPDPVEGLVGSVCWPAALTLAAAAMLMAPRGVAASHRLPVRQLKRAFGGLLLAVCAATLARLAEQTVV